VRAQRLPFAGGCGFEFPIRLKGRKLDARQIWQSVVQLYAENRELEQQVAHARKRIDGNVDGTWPPKDRNPEEEPSAQ
jgi:hypothetical protein